ncbi:MAG TPA: tRNA pseudouridine(55) synthase TruB [Terriglobia bacterium]|jgi:tRNA pseudouridine55 synthase|nr:tRNA pseudouridine(55) synthase TruB [Terriglobia bacterium]
MQETSGVLIIDKPAGMTSHDVVACVRRLLGTRQVGHFGTLDPFATGVLPVSVGKATRFAQFYLKSRKAYEGTIRLGFSTDTYDATGTPTSEEVAVSVEAETLERLFREFTGRLMQTPPPYSAKRVGGTRAYELARQNKPVKLAPVEVEIYALELLSFDGTRARFAAECSGGTYVRSLAHDIGQKLGCGAHLEGLRRTGVAEFTLERAFTLEQLEEAAREQRVADCMVSLESLLPDCPELVVRGREEKSVRHGHKFELAQTERFGRGTGRVQAVSVLKIMNPERRLIAVARHVSGSIYHPDLVLV